MKFFQNKTVRVVLVCLLSCCIFAGIGIGVYAVAHSVRVKKAENFDGYSYELVAKKNVIFMIGDGMGFQHLQVGEAYAGKTLFMRSLSLCGQSRTDSRTLFAPTDSAAGGTALSTGKKTQNGKIAMLDKENVENMAEYAKKLGKAVGIISTETMTGATPASFSAHALSRSLTDEIFASQMASGIDLFICGGRSEVETRATQITSAGYTLVTAYSDLETYETSEKLLATFTEISVGESTEETPTLDELVGFATAYLSQKSENGFFLMVEGSYIDKKSHNNEIIPMAQQLVAFDKAVERAYNDNKNDTCIIVTADHETGNLQYDGESKNELADSMYRQGGHSHADVPYFVYGIQNADIPEVVENVRLSLLARQIMQRQNQ